MSNTRDTFSMGISFIFLSEVFADFVTVAVLVFFVTSEESLPVSLIVQ